MSKIIHIAETPPKLHRGVLYINKVPIYILEMLEDGTDPTYISVYAVQNGSNKEDPIKAYRTEKVIKEYSGKTTLGILAQKMLNNTRKENPNEQYDKVFRTELPPVFMTVVEEGVGTFDNRVGRGFWEREPDSTRIEGDKVKVVRGRRTGVFITLESISWKKIVVPTVEILKQWRAQEVLFFKL